MPTTYTVATTGSDTNPGTTDAPFATLAKAATVVKPGDTVTVLPGQYAGFVAGWDEHYPALLGTADAPITFIGGPGIDIIGRNNKTPDGFNLITCSYVVIDGFRFLSMPLKGVAIDHCQHVTVKNSAALDSGTWGFYATHSDDTTIQDSEASRSKKQHGIYIANGSVNVAVVRCVIRDNANCGLHLNGDGSQGGTGLIQNATILDNLITGNGRTGGAAINCDGAQDSVIAGNVLVGNHAAGITLFRQDASGPSIRNVVRGNTVVMASGSKYALGIKNGSTGNTVQNNILAGATAIVMTPDSLAGTVFAEGSPANYSTDDGDSTGSVEAFKSALFSAPAGAPVTTPPVASPSTPTPPVAVPPATPPTVPPVKAAPTWEAIAAAGYAAYGVSTGGKNFQGNPMPQWPELSDAIRAAWVAAVKAAAAFAAA